MKRNKRIGRMTALLVGATLFGLLGMSSAHAMSFCAGNLDLFKAALAIGNIQSQPYTIMLVQGLYTMDADFVYQMSAPTTIEGGYTTSCAARQVDPANTVINIGHGHVFDFRQDEASPQAAINIDGLTFANSNTGMFFKSGSNNWISNDEGSVRLTRLRFTQITSPDQAILIRSHNAFINLENVQIDHVEAPQICSVALDDIGGGSVTINHMTADLSGGGGFCLFDGDNGSNDAAQMFIYNSILWNSSGAPPIFRANFNENTTVAFFNDIFHSYAIAGTPIVQGQIDADPRWIDPANGNYRLKTNPVSPAINSGTGQIFGGEPGTDIEGHPRIVGSAPDRGAYESSFSDFAVLTVTNTHDSGAGSLRQAMLDANSSPTIAKQIKFDIRDANLQPICPAVIALSSALPTVGSTMTIDGYTQPLSVRNTDADAFNANLCVIAKSAASALPVGFAVPAAAGQAASLTMRGLGVGGFSQPVLILGGLGHLIAGNQFGGTVHGVSLPGAALLEGV